MSAQATNLTAAVSGFEPAAPRRVFRGIARFLTVERAVSELNSLSDRQLADLGMVRANIRESVRAQMQARG